MGKSPKIPDPYRERLHAGSARLSPAGRRVASYIDSNRVAVLASSAMELAARAATSDATVIRTVQALGFTGLAELKHVLLASVDRTSTPADDMRRTLGDVGKDTDRAIEAVIEAHDEAMASLRSPQAKARIAAAVSALHPAARIAIFGIGPSASLAVYVATLLARAGRRTLTLNATGAMLADQMLDLGPGDALLVLALRARLRRGRDGVHRGAPARPADRAGDRQPRRQTGSLSQRSSCPPGADARSAWHSTGRPWCASKP